jgi:hypothetical protein
MRKFGLLFFAGTVLSGSIAVAAQKTFASAEEAAQALVAADERNDTAELLTILGDNAKDLVASGDPAQDNDERAQFVKLARQALKIVPDEALSGHYKVLVGNEMWPLPVPIVKEGEEYRFDTADARIEILARRIGRNELDTIASLRDLVAAEREYAYSDLNRNRMRDYAQLILSTPGKRDGLYWDAKEGDPKSPLAKVIGEASAQGYAMPEGGKPWTYHGYVFRLLKSQGPNARGGAIDYVVRGVMIGGFGIVAYPVEYGVSGIKTFLVNHDGIVWEKDLGPATRTVAPVMKRYNPDKTWRESPN